VRTDGSSELNSSFSGLTKNGVKQSLFKRLKLNLLGLHGASLVLKSSNDASNNASHEIRLGVFLLASYKSERLRSSVIYVKR
jgi:hypothetical protein